MDKDKNLINKYQIGWLLISSFVVLITVIVGLSLKESVFFSYDMPRVALKVQEYLSNGSYLTSQYFFSESSWLNVAWGPALIFFYAILIKINPDPIIVSYLLSFLHSLAVLSFIILGYKIFSPKIGIISGLLFAFNPYIFTYARVIYQPSPLTFLIPLAMFMHFEANNHKKYALILLPFLWVSLFQIYIPTFSFIATSMIFLIFKLKFNDYKYIFIGILTSLILIYPSILFYKENPQYIERFFDAPNRFNPREKTTLERANNVFKSYISIPVGGMFKWQTGSSYKDFITTKDPYYEKISKILTFVFVLSLILESYLAIKKKDLNRGVVVAWTLCAFWYLNVLWTIDLVPRYFLLSLPPAMLLIALFFNDLTKVIKQKKFFRYIIDFLPVVVIIYWVVFNINYNSFIKSYSFPYGWFSDIAETPYVYIKKTLDYVISDSSNKKCQPVITNDINNPNFVLWMETEYPWKYIYKRELTINDGEKCYYLISHESTFNNNEDYKDYLKFGPFGVGIKKLETNPSEFINP